MQHSIQQNFSLTQLSTLNHLYSLTIPILAMHLIGNSVSGERYRTTMVLLFPRSGMLFGLLYEKSSWNFQKVVVQKLINSHEHILQ